MKLGPIAYRFDTVSEGLIDSMLEAREDGESGVEA